MRTVFLTGATGVVGCELVPRLLRDSETQVSLLIRGRDEEHVRQRFGRLLDYWGPDFPDPELKRVKLLQGDVCQPRLGLEPAVYAELSEIVTNVVHAAGNVKLNQSLEAARRTAVGGLDEIIRLCRASEELGNFRKLDYVSTVGVAGRMPGLIPERRLTEPREFHNTYEQAKAEAEEILWEEIARGLPATIHRPSMVVGDSKTGKILEFQVFYHLCEFLSGRRTWGILPKLGEARLDIVPVDFVADMLVAAILDENLAGEVIHHCSGPNDAVRLDDLVGEVRRHFTAFHRPLPKLRQISPVFLRAVLPIVNLLAYGRKWKSLRALPPLVTYLSTCQSQRFDTIRSDGLSVSIGFNRPQHQEYLKAVFSYYCGCRKVSTGISTQNLNQPEPVGAK